MSHPNAVVCAEQNCAASIEPGKSGYVSKWATMAAQTAGWFFQRDGTAYCAEHVPAWVADWRASHR